MAVENDFLPFAIGSGANVLSQADYAALTSLLQNGFQSGIANSQQLNKVWRQGSIMAAVLAQFIAQQTGQNVIDDGTTATLLANLISAVQLSAPGRLLRTSVYTLVSGTVMCSVNGGTATALSTFTPLSSTTTLGIQVGGASGASGGCPATSSTQNAVAAGGAAGGFAESLLSVAAITSPVPITIGAPGVASATAGGAGGSSSFGSYLSATGGNGGSVGVASAAAYVLQGPSGGLGSGGNMQNTRGDSGGQAFMTAVGAALSGKGGVSPFCAGGNGNGGSSSGGGYSNATSPCAGPGGVAIPASTAALNGLAGMSGQIIVKEFA